jgi:hypothetical protein
MRALLLPLLLLAASCSGEAEKAQPSEAAGNGSAALGSELQTFAGAGKDRLCIGGVAAPAAFITYAPDGINNCSARGRIEDQGGKLSFVAQEDASCRIDVQRDGDARLTLGRPSPGCAYYCGPGASLENKTFTRMAKPEPVSDLADDPLC